MVDMISPKDPHSITLSDMLKPEKRLICGTDLLTNSSHFLSFFFVSCSGIVVLFGGIRCTLNECSMYVCVCV